jgi:putative phage-type endonuclease
VSAVDTVPTIGTAHVVARIDDLDRLCWLDLRRHGIGGSDAAAICGQDRWRSAFEVWLDKTAAPNLPVDEMSEAAEWGILLEPVVREQTARRQQVAIAPAPFLVRSATDEFMLANLDGLAWELRDPQVDPAEGVYEGKTAGVWSAEGWEDDGVPDAYLLQGMHYLAVTGLDWLIYGVLIGGQRLEVRRVQRDQELIDHLVTIEAEFWQRVLDRTPPAPDGSKACTDLLAHLYDVKPDSVLVVDDADEIINSLHLRDAYKAEAKAAEEAAAEQENRLKVLLGDHEVMQLPDGHVLCTWKQHDVNRLDGTALKADRPDVAAAFTKTTTQRRFHVPKGAI